MTPVNKMIKLLEDPLDLSLLLEDCIDVSLLVEDLKPIKPITTLKNWYVTL